MGNITAGTISGGTLVCESKRSHEGDERKDRTKRTKTTDSKIDEFVSPMIYSSQHDQTHEDMNNDHDNGEVVSVSQSHVLERELEDGLLQESPDAIANYKLIIDDVCIRTVIEKWRETSKYVEEIHKQDLMRYNIIDTTRSSATEARKLLKDYWEDVICTIEKFSMSRPDTTPVDSDSDSASAPTDQDGRAEDIRKYLTEISKNVNTTERLCDAITTEREKLRVDGNIKWKKRSLELMKIFREQFPNGRNCFNEDQTEYDYIIRFVSRVYIMLFKDRPLFKCSWGEKTLRCSAILLNQSLKDDDRRCSGNKIDAIMSILDLGLEFSTLEVSGSPSSLDHTHYVGDKNKTAEMLKIILNYIFIKYPGDFEKFRRIKVYGVQIYGHNFYIYSMCMPFAGIYYFKLEMMFSCPTIAFLFFKELPIFASNLWMLRDIITSSSESIVTYITSSPSEIGSDNAMIANVEVSPKNNKKSCRNN